MSALIVGGDRIDGYREFLNAHGFARVDHWSGRRAGECHRPIPERTQVVIILVDQVNHGLAAKTRRIAGALGLPVVHARRSLPQLGAALARVAAPRAASRGAAR